MRALHGAWVVHRDLKMPNLLVSKHGVLKVRDTRMSMHAFDAGVVGPGTTG
jgi:serine/threonine protein kinase